MPKVSILLCSYNQRRYVGEALESVLAQTYDDYEVIVLDNGSTDGSQELLRGYADRPKVRLVLGDANIALSKRFNQGIAMAAGELVGFLYSDDLYLPRKLELQVAEFDQLGKRYGVVCSGAKKFDDRTKDEWTLPPLRSHGDVLDELLREGGPSDMLSPLVRRECFLRYPFYEDIFGETESAYLKLAMTYWFGTIPEPTVLLRETGTNVGRAMRPNTEMSLAFLDRLGEHPDFPARHRDALLASRRLLLRTAAWSTVRMDGDVAWARKCYRDAVKLDWREVLEPRTAAGYALSFVPTAVRSRLNALGHRITRTEGAKNLTEGFPDAGS